jgi:hypothetical protein
LPRKEEKKWRRIGYVQPNQLQLVVRRTVRCPGWPDGELTALGKKRRRRVYNSLDCPMSQRSSARSTGNTWLSQRSDGHTRLSGAPTRPKTQRSASPEKGRRSCTGQELFMSGGAPDCPVHHPTEGNNCLPIGSPTAPSYLGAIKGTPRSMEHYTKHSLNNLRHLHSAATHLDRCVRDLSTFRVENSCAVFLCSSLGLCACVCCVSSFACVAF